MASAHEAAQRAETVSDLLRLLQWQIVHESHSTGWATRNPGMWFCFDCGSPAPTHFDGSER